MACSILKFQSQIGKSGLPATVRHVALVVSSHADKISGENAYPSIRTLEARTGRSRPVVCRALRELNSKGWLNIEERAGRGRGWRHRRYSLRLPGDSQGGNPGLPRQAAPSLYIKNTYFLTKRAGDKSPKTTAATLWRDVVSQIARCGRYRVPDLPTEVLAAIRQIGGWSALCGAYEGDLRPGGIWFQKFAAALEVGQ